MVNVFRFLSGNLNTKFRCCLFPVVNRRYRKNKQVNWIKLKSVKLGRQASACDALNKKRNNLGDTSGFCQGAVGGNFSNPTSQIRDLCFFQLARKPPSQSKNHYKIRKFWGNLARFFLSSVVATTQYKLQSDWLILHTIKPRWIIKSSLIKKEKRDGDRW